MSIQFCQSFLLEQLLAIHDFSSDTIKVALYTGQALDDETTAYTTANEAASGNGYTAGGVTIVPSSGYPRIEARAGAVRFDPAEWTFTTGKTVSQALIYNASKGNRAIVVLSLGGNRSFVGAFSIQFPIAANPIIFNRAPMPSE